MDYKACFCLCLRLYQMQMSASVFGEVCANKLSYVGENVGFSYFHVKVRLLLVSMNCKNSDPPL